jgi:hypothetical protein
LLILLVNSWSKSTAKHRHYCHESPFHSRCRRGHSVSDGFTV